MLRSPEIKLTARYEALGAARALDMPRAQVNPEPVAVGSYARFLENRDAIQLVPANPGFFLMYYVLRRSREILERLTAVQRAEIKKTAGSLYFDLWTPEDSTDWLEAALMCERDIFEKQSGNYHSTCARFASLVCACDSLTAVSPVGDLHTAGTGTGTINAGGLGGTSSRLLELLVETSVST